MSACVYCAHAYGCLPRSEEVTGFPRVVRQGHCEPSSMGVKNWTSILCKSRSVLSHHYSSLVLPFSASSEDFVNFNTFNTLVAVNKKFLHFLFVWKILFEIRLCVFQSQKYCWLDDFHFFVKWQAILHFFFFFWWKVKSPNFINCTFSIKINYRLLVCKISKKCSHCWK